MSCIERAQIDHSEDIELGISELSWAYQQERIEDRHTVKRYSSIQKGEDRRQTYHRKVTDRHFHSDSEYLLRKGGLLKKSDQETYLRNCLFLCESKF